MLCKAYSGLFTAAACCDVAERQEPKNPNPGILITLDLAVIPTCIFHAALKGRNVFRVSVGERITGYRIGSDSHTKHFL